MIAVLKLITGEVLLSKIDEPTAKTNTIHLNLSKTMTIIQTAIDKFALAPYMPYVKQDEEIGLDINHILMIATASEELANNLNSINNGIVTAKTEPKSPLKLV